jgi:hypothetical protein
MPAPESYAHQALTAMSNTMRVVRVLPDTADTGRPRARPPCRFWTGREEMILRKAYPEGGLRGCLEKLPGRSAKSICHRASLLKLSSPFGRRQISEHTDRLIIRTCRNNATSGPGTVILDWPGRRLVADGIKLFLGPRQADLLALLADGYPRTTDSLIIEMYGDREPDWAANSIHAMLHHLQRKLRSVAGAPAIYHRKEWGYMLSEPLRVLRRH